MHVNADHSFPVVRVGDISSEPNTQRWLVDELWGASSVGVIGGAPKLRQDMAGAGHGSLRGDRHGVPW